MKKNDVLEVLNEIKEKLSEDDQKLLIEIIQTFPKEDFFDDEGDECDEDDF